MRDKQNCKSCKWKYRTTCTCPESDYVGDGVDDCMWCMEWERKKEPEKLSNDILLGQIAEECAELIHAIEKFRRTGTENPTPVKAGEAWDKILDEIADVDLCIQVFTGKLPSKAVKKIVMKEEVKYERWCSRLNRC